MRPTTIVVGEFSLIKRAKLGSRFNVLMSAGLPTWISLSIWPSARVVKSPSLLGGPGGYGVGVGVGVARGVAVAVGLGLAVALLVAEIVGDVVGVSVPE